VTLILRRMADNADCRDEELADLLTLRRHLAQRGWFN
jgi:hypothetical protein